MAKAYWVSCYRSISDPDALAAYAKLAGPAIAAAGGRFLARANAAKAYEAGVADRVVLIEFDSLERAVAAHEGAPYQAALKVLGKAVERDLRIVEGLASPGLSARMPRRKHGQPRLRARNPGTARKATRCTGIGRERGTSGKLLPWLSRPNG